MNIKKIIEKTGLNPRTMAREELIILAQTKGFGIKALHEVMENSDGQLTMDDYRAARAAYAARKAKFSATEI